MTDRDFSNAIHADMPHWGNSFVVKAQQVLYAGGGIRSGVRQSQLEKQIAEQEHLNSRQDLRFMLAGYYLDLFQLRNQELVYRKNIEQTRLLVKDMQAAYRQGTALKSDITRYELQLQNLELGLTSTANRLNVLNHRLVTTLGIEPGTHIVPDTLYLKQVLIEERQESEWAAGIGASPTMQLAGLGIKLEQNRRKLIQSEQLPHISLSATNELNGPILIEVPPLNNNFAYWFVGVGISYNIDALFKGKRKLRQADISIQKQEEKRRLAKEEQTQRLEQNESDIKLAEAALNLAKLNLSYTIILANADGVTGRKNIHEGELVQQGQTLVTLVDGTEKWVIANYKETQTTYMKRGQLVEVKVDAIPDVVYEGRIASISDATGSFYSIIPQDNSAGNFVKVEQRIPVRIEFTPNNSKEALQRLRAGMNAECYVEQ